MKTSRTLVKILSLALVFAMMFTLVSCNLFGGSLKLESFTVDRSSVKTSYYIGEEIDFSGIKAVAKYSDSSLDKEYTAADLTVTYDPDITATVGQRASVDRAMRSTTGGYLTVTKTSGDICFTDSDVRYALFPGWFLQVRYKDKTYPFAINGQTGKMSGKLPISPIKFALWLLGLTAVIGALAAFIALCI